MSAKKRKVDPGPKPAKKQAPFQQGKKSFNAIDNENDLAVIVEGLLPDSPTWERDLIMGLVLARWCYAPEFISPQDFPQMKDQQTVRHMTSDRRMNDILELSRKLGIGKKFLEVILKLPKMIVTMTPLREYADEPAVKPRKGKLADD